MRSRRFTKHGADFGLTGNWRPSRGAEFSRAVDQHINSAGTRAVSGTYRTVGEVTHYVDPSTGLNVIAAKAGSYVSGWKLSPEQLEGVLTTGTHLLMNGSHMGEEGISLKLTRAEALVFFQWLSRNDEVESTRCDDPAEQQVLWKLEGQLEKVLVEPLRPDYVQLVAEARNKINESG